MFPTLKLTEVHILASEGGLYAEADDTDLELYNQLNVISLLVWFLALIPGERSV